MIISVIKLKNVFALLWLKKVMMSKIATFTNSNLLEIIFVFHRKQANPIKNNERWGNIKASEMYFLATMLITIKKEKVISLVMLFW